jgi:hypothetical protein
MFLSTGPALLVDVPREKNITGKWTSLFVTFLFLVIASLHVNENFFWGVWGWEDAVSKFQYMLFNFLLAASSYVMYLMKYGAVSVGMTSSMCMVIHKYLYKT